MVMTLLVTFAVTVALALVVLLSVAAPPLRQRGSRSIARLDAWAARVLPVVRHHHERASRKIADRLEVQREAQRRAGGEDRAQAR
jgi:hypothetical protein